MSWCLRISASRCFEVASLDTLPECVSSCWELLHSEAFFLLLSNFTGLRLHYLCPADDDEEKGEKEQEEEEEEMAGSSTKPSTSSSSATAANASRDKGKSELFFYLVFLFVGFNLWVLQSWAHLRVVGKCVAGLMAATLCCMMVKQHRRNMPWTWFYLLAAQVSRKKRSQQTKTMNVTLTEVVL